MGAGELTTYDASEVKVMFGIIPLNDNREDGEFLKIKMNAEGYGAVVGVGGEVARWKNNDETGIVEITLMATAGVNAALSSLYLLDRSTPQGAGVKPLLIKDVGGHDMHMSQNAWIIGPPEVSYAKEVKMNTWKIYCARLKMFCGGHAQISA